MTIWEQQLSDRMVRWNQCAERCIERFFDEQRRHYLSLAARARSALGWDVSCAHRLLTRGEPMTLYSLGVALECEPFTSLLETLEDTREWLKDSENARIEGIRQWAMLERPRSPDADADSEYATQHCGLEDGDDEGVEQFWPYSHLVEPEITIDLDDSETMFAAALRRLEERLTRLTTYEREDCDG